MIPGVILASVQLAKELPSGQRWVPIHASSPFYHCWSETRKFYNLTRRRVAKEGSFPKVPRYAPTSESDSQRCLVIFAFLLSAKGGRWLAGRNGTGGQAQTTV